MQKITIEQASDTELRDFAIGVLQIEKVPRDRAGILSAIIDGGWTNDYISVPGDQPQAASDHDEPVAVVPQFGTAGEIAAPMPTSGFSFWTQPAKGKPKCPMVTLRLQTTERPGGNEPAMPIVNNSPPLVVQRNKLVTIPYDFYLVLQQAGGTKWQSNIADVKAEPVKIDYSEYPMQDVVLPSAKEVADWNEWAGQHELGRPKAQAA